MTAYTVTANDVTSFNGEMSAAPAAHPLTIEQLAAETGLTVRNIRSHRARNLLQPPIVHERVGYYGAEHVARLHLIRELQAEGFNLAAIKRVIESAPDTADGLLSAMQAVTEPFESETPQVVTRDELAARFQVDDPDRVLGDAEKLGVLVPLGDGRYEAPVPSLLTVAEELVSRGVPLHHSLAVVKKVRSSSQTVAREFIRLFVEDLFRPFQDSGMPADEWPKLLEAIERLRPMSAQVVLGIYQLTMTEEVERAAHAQLRELFKSRTPRK
jgi:DNA-binding transcriptional MerR regulator